MIVVCAPNPGLLPPGDLVFSMLGAPFEDTFGVVGRTFREAVRRQGLDPSIKAWDFALLALAIIAADHGCLRKESPDGWTREIELHIALVQPEIWEPHLELLAQALRFLSGDIWSLKVHQGGLSPLTRTRRTKTPIVEGDCVCLLSGGVDSLIGGIDLVAQGFKPVFVSQVAKGDSDRQSTFATAIGQSQCGHVQLTHAVNVPDTSERSQRARSVMFLALGSLVASTIEDDGACELIVPENGFISYNVPLTHRRIGSLSTRTTHPHFLGLVQQLWDNVGIKTQIRNPYQHMTKGEMLSQCSNQTLLRSHVFSATSCGRFGRFGYQHCGRCVPCLVRRAAFLAWGQVDTTQYVYTDLGAQDDFDDVRSSAMACIVTQRRGVRRWSRNALSCLYVDDVDSAESLVGRGLNEIRALLERQGVL